jgi:hypothetical protein
MFSIVCFTIHGSSILKEYSFLYIINAYIFLFLLFIGNRLLAIQFNFNSIYLCAKLNSSEANYKISTGKKMGRVRNKKISENNVLIKIKIIKYKMTMSTLLLLLITTT